MTQGVARHGVHPPSGRRHVRVAETSYNWHTFKSTFEEELDRYRVSAGMHTHTVIFHTLFFARTHTGRMNDRVGQLCAQLMWESFFSQLKSSI